METGVRSSMTMMTGQQDGRVLTSSTGSGA